MSRIGLALIVVLCTVQGALAGGFGFSLGISKGRCGGTAVAVNVQVGRPAYVVPVAPAPAVLVEAAPPPVVMAAPPPPPPEVVVEQQVVVASPPPPPPCVVVRRVVAAPPRVLIVHRAVPARRVVVYQRCR